MNPRRYVRAGGALARVLLVVVLTLGVFVMHTLGHPNGSASSASSGTHGAGTAHHAMGMDGIPSPSLHTASASRIDSQSAPLQAHATHATHPAPSADPSSHYTPGPGTGMDMASLCMAVLATWTFAMLLRAALARRPGWLADVLAKAVVMMRPNAPPRGPDLTQLSVLRI